jgi:Rrf2 family cysteine metabolism transcriptional repressor
MNISARCEYACRATVELAGHEHKNEPRTATSIAEARGIPGKYLVHILLQLKRANVVRSVRGAQGGYLLARAADSITLYDVMSAVDGPVLDPLPVSDNPDEALAPTWAAVSVGIEAVLKGVTIRSILDGPKPVDMYYI